MDDLLLFIIDKLEYDFCEDDDDVQGTWEIMRDGNTVHVAFDPFPDSPNPRALMVYRIERVS